MDLVYILGKDSTWDNNELRYSLRSVERYGIDYDNIFLIGEKPDWINEEYITHIYKDDPYENKQRNIHEKLLTASEDERIGEVFVSMNDDYFLLDYYELDNILPIYENTLMYFLKRNNQHRYGKHIAATMNFLHDNDYYNFDTHYPFPIDKELYIKANKSVNWDVRFGYLTRTLYFHYVQRHSKPKRFINQRDCLISRPDAVIPIDANIISVSKNGLTDQIKNLLQTKFPNKSIYET